MQIIKYIILYLASFIFTSVIDAVWHLGLFGQIYGRDIKKVAPMVDGQLAFKALPGLLSQVLVVLAVSILVLYKRPEVKIIDGAILGAMAGVLAITVYGLVNYALIKNWTFNLTILEVVWGPIIGGLSGIFVVWLKTMVLKF